MKKGSFNEYAVSGRQPIELASGATFGSDDNKFNYGTDST